MNINIHAGHNPDGKVASGAIGVMRESTENRNVVNHAINLFKQQGHKVYDCTVNDGVSQSDVLKKILSKCNTHIVDLDIAVHFNAGVDDLKGNGITTGVEVLIYDNSSKSKSYAQRVADKISKDFGIKNRGVKVVKNLYYLRHCNSPAMLIECCFIDDKDDISKYSSEKMAKSIVEGVLNKSISGTAASTTTTNTNEVISGSYKNGDYNKKGMVVNVGSGGLRVRSDRNTDSQIVKVLKEGDVINLSYCLDNWFSTYDIKNNGEPCYVYGKYIKLL